ncbi:Uncharacterised protein [Serratia marcescens]|uniref:hypothetical protein n=1 Tax=Serratia marcescens TaxID=615 RepID=UPI00074556D4|nr:hypothetical protein [Serratia marcescens]CVF89721.1 Uncharacterised protein [Serratia marcescens]
MKDKIINMLMNRPDWFNHEGYYRVLVIVRFLLFVPIVLWAGACIVLWSPPGEFAEGLTYCAMGIALAFGVIFVLNFLLRVVGWVVVGFKQDKV